MRLKSRLTDWQEHGFLTEDQADNIMTYEKDRVRGLFHTGLKYSGLLAILLGISLIVAANWDLFSASMRLVGHIVLNALVAFMIWRWRDNPDRRSYKEGAVYILSGLTLTLLALIGQSFQLQGDIGTLLVVWTALITGMVVLFGQHVRVANLWALGFVVTLYYAYGNIADYLAEPLKTFFCLTVVVLLPLALWCDGHIRKLRDINMPFADMLVRLGFTAAIISGFGASLIFYEGGTDFIVETGLSSSEFNIYLGLLAAVTVAAFAGAWVVFKRNHAMAVPALCALFAFIPFVIPVESTVMAAVHFIALAVLIGVAAYHDGDEKMLNLCILAVSIRLFAIFAEVFGTMLMTGWGLIIGGLMLFGLVKIMRSLQSYIVSRQREGQHHA